MKSVSTRDNAHDADSNGGQVTRPAGFHSHTIDHAPLEIVQEILDEIVTTFDVTVFRRV